MQLLLQGHEAQPQSLCPTKLFANLDTELGACTDEQQMAAKLPSAGMPAATSFHTTLIARCYTCMPEGTCTGIAELPCSKGNVSG